VLLGLAPEELASQLLIAVTQHLRKQGGNFSRDQISRFAREYPSQQDEIEVAITEAWRWLEVTIHSPAYRGGRMLHAPEAPDDHVPLGPCPCDQCELAEHCRRQLTAFAIAAVAAS
jgi:hypothetical protein